MNIQLIDYNASNEYNFQVSKISQLSNPMSFDEYDLNIIDLRSPYIWRNKEINGGILTIDVINDFKSLNDLINRAEKSYVLLILPKNLKFKTKYNNYTNKYQKSISLKDMMDSFNNLLIKIHGVSNIKFLYESTTTKWNSETLSSDFIFEPHKTFITHIKSNKSNRIVSISKNNLHITTLDIIDNSKLTTYLEKNGIIKNEINMPKWLEDADYFDDAERKQLINENNKKIEDLNSEIANAENKLNKNNHYKSILYSSGEQLVSVVREILEEILEIDLANFEDKFNEDIRFKYKNDIYIVEVKGNNKGVRLNNVTQLHNHTVTFVEENEEFEKDKIEYDNVYSLLIMTPQRLKPLNERDEVDKDIIDNAKNKYDSLIIRTKDLLKCFEKIQNKKMEKNTFIKLIQKKGTLNSYEPSI